MNQQQSPNDTEVFTGVQSTPQCSPQELFRYVDEQESKVVSQMERCELKRKELVKEMTEHMQSFEFSSMGNPEDPLFQRHTELTKQLSALHQQYNKLEKQLASVHVLSDKRKETEASMQRRLMVVNNGGHSNFTVDELHQIIESQAAATLEVEILNQERNMLETLLKETTKTKELLRLQCSEKDERIKLLKQQNQIYQNELASFQSGSTVSSHGSSTQLSCLRSNLAAQNAYIRKRLNTRHSNRDLQSSSSSLSVPNPSDDVEKPMAPPTTVLSVAASNSISEPKIEDLKAHMMQSANIPNHASNKSNQTDPLAVASDDDNKHKVEEKKLRLKQQHLADEAKKEEERRLREQRMHNEAASLKKQQQLAEEAKNKEENQLREQRLQNEASQEDERRRLKQQEQKSKQIAEDSAAKEEERRIRQMQEQKQAAQEAKELMASPKASQKGSQGRMLSPGSVTSRSSFESTYQNQAKRQAARMRSSGGASLASPTPSVGSSRASREISKAGYVPGPRPPFGALPGAVRMTATGQLLDDDDDDNDGNDSVGNCNDDNDSAADSAFAVTATLVREQNINNFSTEQERQFERRERELAAREAEIAKQSRSLHGLSATAQVAAVPVAAVATPVATISRQGSYRELGRQFSSLSDTSLSASNIEEQSIRTMGTIGEDSAIPDLGEGPLRFHPANERPMRQQFMDISDKDYECFQTLQARWEKKRKAKGGMAPYSESIILRFLRNTSGKNGSFSLNKAWKAMKKCKERNIFLSAGKLQKQLLSATLFPVPGLVSNAGFDMFYMKPSRYFRKDSVRDVIDNLVYVMNCMLEKERNSKNGIGFMACMNDWTMSNFDTSYCYQFMMALQGAVVPVAIELFLIVNPPSWFGQVWKVMRPMLAPSFRKKVKVIKESMLDQYLLDGFQWYLPDDFSSGTVNTMQLAKDFVTYRKHIEMGNAQLNAKSATIDEDSVSHFSVTSSTNISDDGSGPLTYKYSGSQPLDASSSHVSSSESEYFGGSVYESSSHGVENEDDDASIHCSIDGDGDEENMDLMEV